MGGGSLGDGVAWLTRRRLTLAIVGLLVAVYAAEFLVRTSLGTGAWRYLFFATAEPTPGWLLSPFAHLGPAHLGSSLAFVAVYGSLAETYLDARDYLGLYLLAGYVAVAFQTGFYRLADAGGGAIGASGAVLALVGFVVVTVATEDGGPTGSTTVVAHGFAWVGAAVVVAVLASDFVPWVDLASSTARFGHLGGVLAGGLVGLARAG